MRAVLACALVFSLVNVISVCPMLAHEASQQHSCCPQSPVPCSDNSSGRCPYVLLEKSKAESSILAWALALAPALTIPGEELHARQWFFTLNIRPSHRDVSDSYLRFRVLLI